MDRQKNVDRVIPFPFSSSLPFTGTVSRTGLSRTISPGWVFTTASLNFSSFLTTMFAPMAQGTIRPWSERGFFLLFYKLFEAERASVSHRGLCHAIRQSGVARADLLALTGQQNRRHCAPSPCGPRTSVLITPLCWVSDYNQIQCAFFLLLAFLLYLHDRYWLQMAVFTLRLRSPGSEYRVSGDCAQLRCFLSGAFRRAKESSAPSRCLESQPLITCSTRRFAPTQKTGVYALHFDRSLAHSTTLHLLELSRSRQRILATTRSATVRRSLPPPS